MTNFQENRERYFLKMIMILHLGGDVIVPIMDIIAIIDMETTKNSIINKEFLKIAEEEGFIKNISDDPPKSFILAEINKKSVIFMSPISSVTLLKRSGFVEGISLDREDNKGDLNVNTGKKESRV